MVTEPWIPPCEVQRTVCIDSLVRQPGKGWSLASGGNRLDPGKTGVALCPRADEA